MALFEGDFRGSQLGMTKAFMLLDQDVIINAEKESSRVLKYLPNGHWDMTLFVKNGKGQMGVSPLTRSRSSCSYFKLFYYRSRNNVIQALVLLYTHPHLLRDFIRWLLLTFPKQNKTHFNPSNNSSVFFVPCVTMHAPHGQLVD